MADLPDAGHHTDSEEAFYERTAAKYADADRRHTEAEDGVDDEQEEDAGASEDDAQEESEDDADQTDEDQSAHDRDGDGDESDEESVEGEAESDQTDEESDEDAADEEDAGESEGDAEAEGASEEDSELSEELEAAADRHKIPLSVEDIKDPTARQLVTSRLKEMDAGFTRAMQEARAFRKKETAYEAERLYREQNPELAVVEMISAALKKDKGFIDKVQERLDKNADPEAAEVFAALVEKRKQESQSTVESHLGELERRYARAAAVENTARKVAQREGLPWRLAEKEIERALLRKPESERDLTDDEIAAAIRAEATEYKKEQRGLRRADSKKSVQERTANRKTVGQRAAAVKGAVTPKPAGTRPAKVDPENEEQRINAGMALARRLFPGKK